MLKPIEILRGGIHRVSQGDYEYRLDITGNDETRVLGLDFNDMVQALGKKTDRLSKLYELGVSSEKLSGTIMDKITTVTVSLMAAEMAMVTRIKDGFVWPVSIYRDGRFIRESEFPLAGTPCGETVKRKKPCRYSRTAEKFPGSRFLRQHHVDSYLGVPILSGSGEVLGIISIMDSRSVEFSEEDEKMLYTLAKRVAFEWEQTDYIRKIESRNMRLDALYTLSYAFSETMDLHRMLDNTLAIITRMEFLNLRKEALIFLMDEKNQELVLAAHRGISEEEVRYDRRVKLGECLCGQAAKSGQLLFSPNSAKNPQHTRRIPGTGVHGDICVPLKAGGRTTGLLHLHREPNIPHSEEELDIFKTLGNQLGMAIENAQLFQTTQKHHSELEQKVEERTREIQTINKNLERANQAKSDFLSGMSHELRTPLNAIIGFSEVLKDQHFGQLNEKQAEYIHDILESGRHLLSLINDILDLSKVEAGRMELEISRVRIRDLLENSLIMIKEKAYKHAIRLDLQVPDELSDLEIQADERKLKQILFNLLSNAAKFTPARGSITIAARQLSFINGHWQTQDGQGTALPMTNDARNASQMTHAGEQREPMTRGNFIEISVTDTGIGITPEDSEKIFKEFYQVRGGMADKTPGTGLGLPLSRQLVEMHGGRIWVESNGEGKGSRFRFVLPVEPVPLDGGSPESGTDRSLGPENILGRLNETIRFCKKYARGFTLCRLKVDAEPFEETFPMVLDTLVKEKRPSDTIGVGREERSVYLILKETDRNQAKIACNRFAKKLESVLDGHNVTYFLASFPENGESAEALVESVRAAGQGQQV